MGCDFLDLQFRMEKEFHLQFRTFDHHKLASPRDARGYFTEVTGRHILNWLEVTLREHDRAIPDDAWPRLQRIIARVGVVPVETVGLDDCLIHDLGFQ